MLVAVAADINAVQDRYDAPHVDFIISSVPRGGFSGGPVIHSAGFLLGVLTDELSVDPATPEAPFAAALSVEPIRTLLDVLELAPTQNCSTCFLLDPTADESPAFTGVPDPPELEELRRWREDPIARPEPVDLGRRSPALRDGESLWTRPRTVRGPGDSVRGRPRP